MATAAAKRKGDEELNDSKLPKPSTYEKPPNAGGPMYADGWPDGLASWPFVLLTAGFVALFNRNTYESWQAAVRLVRTAPAAVDADLRLLSAVLPLDRIWTTFWSADNFMSAWKFITPSNADLANERLIMYVFDILQTMRIKLGQSDVQSDETITRTFFAAAEAGTIGGLVQQVVRMLPPPVQNRIRTIQDVRDLTAPANLYGHHRAVAAGRKPTALRIVRIDMAANRPEPTPDDGLYRALNTASGCFAVPFYNAIRTTDIQLAIELLKYLPILELDLYRAYPTADETGNGSSGWQSPEYWSDDDRFDLLIGAARGYMARYRRDRDVLIRTLLADLLPYDVFGLIDSYGAQPEIVRRRRN